MIDEQEFHHRFSGFDDFYAIGMDKHAFRHRSGTGRHQFRCFVDFDEAHAAAGRNRQFLVIAEMRDRLARVKRDLKQ